MKRKSKYEEIVDWVKGQIDEKKLEAGDKLPSENELAVTFKVSRQTVRHAISILENQSLLERRRGSGTYISVKSSPQKIVKEKTMRIAIVITYVDEYIFPALIKSIEKELSKAGYTLQIAFTNNAIEKERMILKSLLENGMIDGIIAEATKSGLPSPNLLLYKEIYDRGIPLLFLNSSYPEMQVPCVRLDDKQAGKIVTEHLLQCGHRKIGAVLKGDDGQGHQRYAGYVEALMEADVKIRSERIIWIDTEDLRHMENVQSLILNRLAECTACVCYNDEVANKLVKVCMEQGIKVPEELSVVSIDNSDLSKYCEVPITSATNPLKELGRAASELMMRMINGEEINDGIQLTATLEIRNSVKIIYNH